MTNAQIRIFEEKKIFGRYITLTDIEPLLFKLSKKKFALENIGYSVLNTPIYKVTVGVGNTKVLLWSQMHGNESTTTKAVFDLFNLLNSDSEEAEMILKNCTLVIIPMLNPDGAKRYTRENANGIDLNRDAKNLSQPESKLLRACFDDFNPDFCYNLHGQRTIFGVGNKPASLSFLAPSQDEDCTVTPNRKTAMGIIAFINEELQKDIPKGVGLYDDAYNPNCVGDTFQSLGVPTILFEAGHFPNDYNREKVRFLILKSLFKSLFYVSKNKYFNDNYLLYTGIPKNKKSFFDIIIRNVILDNTTKQIVDAAFQYKEVLIDGKIDFIPYFTKHGQLNSYYGHKTIEGEGNYITTLNGSFLELNEAYSTILLNNDKLSLNLY